MNLKQLLESYVGANDESAFLLLEEYRDKYDAHIFDLVRQGPLSLVEAGMLSMMSNVVSNRIANNCVPTEIDRESFDVLDSYVYQAVAYAYLTGLHGRIDNIVDTIDRVSNS